MVHQFVDQQLQSISDHKVCVESFINEQTEWLTEHQQATETFHQQQASANQVKISNLSI